MQFSALTVAALVSLASAQSNQIIHPVIVGGNGTLTFSPAKLTAAVGEWVQFQFVAGAHTATQSSFDVPCAPINSNTNITGFHSGSMPVAASIQQGEFPTFAVQINNTNPIWVYCATGSHCGSGMVMVINEPATNPNRTLERYRAAAAQAQTVPGGAPGGGSTGTTPTGPSGSTPVSPSASASQTAGAVALAGSSVMGLLAFGGAAALLF